MSQKFGDWFRNNYRGVIIGALAFVPFIVSIISTIHVVNFFKLSNFSWLAVTLAIAFEVGALSALAAIAVMDKINKFSLWSIFILITLMQMMGNTYYAFDFISNRMLTDPTWTQNWIDLFSINNAEIGVTKRILAIVSGAILPIISLTFLDMLITYIAKTRSADEEESEYEYITVDEDGNEIVEEIQQYSGTANIGYSPTTVDPQPPIVKDHHITTDNTTENTKIIDVDGDRLNVKIKKSETPKFELYDQDGTKYEPEETIEEDENTGDDLKEQMKKVPNALKNLIEKIGSDINVKNVLQKLSKKDDDGKPYIDLSGVFEQTRIVEGKERGNKKIVTTPKPIAQPAPQPNIQPAMQKSRVIPYVPPEERAKMVEGVEQPIIIPTVPPEDLEHTVEGVIPPTNKKKKGTTKKPKSVAKKPELQVIEQEEIVMEKDNTFIEPLQEDMPVEIEPIIEEQPLDLLKGTVEPQKKKILLYKEKKN